MFIVISDLTLATLGFFDGRKCEALSSCFLFINDLKDAVGWSFLDPIFPFEDGTFWFSCSLLSWLLPFPNDGQNLKFICIRAPQLEQNMAAAVSFRMQNVNHTYMLSGNIEVESHAQCR